MKRQTINKTSFQRTVTDVLALRPVFDVMTLVTYAPGSTLTTPASQAKKLLCKAVLSQTFTVAAMFYALSGAG